MEGAKKEGDRVLSFTLGYSHPIVYKLPDGIEADVDKKQTSIVIRGIDKQLVGQVAANLVSLRPPDAYKGKGIRYEGMRLKLKEGKKA
ncbi:MAG: 50S ribosomal protein L6 [Nitrospirae bacterium]|nr:MAG: 50S ribosomal protein L6 [Nitrospirota bacterium]